MQPLSKLVTTLLITLAAPYGCGGEPDSPALAPDVSPDPFACNAPTDLGLEEAMIEDFELGVATDFYTNADGTPGSSVIPAAGISSPPASSIEGGRCGVSTQALRMQAAGLEDWGMAFGLELEASDVQSWDGFSFWARRGPASARSLFFSVTDAGTIPSDDTCDEEPEDLVDKCDPYGAGIGLEESWRYFAIPFSDLRQRGFGVPTESLDVRSVQGLSWAAEPGDWDVWIDDLALYRRGN